MIALRRTYRRISARQKRVTFFHWRIPPRTTAKQSSPYSIIRSVWYRVRNPDPNPPFFHYFNKRQRCTSILKEFLH